MNVSYFFVKYLARVFRTVSATFFPWYNFQYIVNIFSIPGGIIMQLSLDQLPVFYLLSFSIFWNILEDFFDVNWFADVHVKAKGTCKGTTSVRWQEWETFGVLFSYKSPHIFGVCLYSKVSSNKSKLHSLHSVHVFIMFFLIIMRSCALWMGELLFS